MERCIAQKSSLYNVSVFSLHGRSQGGAKGAVARGAGRGRGANAPPAGRARGRPAKGRGRK